MLRMSTSSKVAEVGPLRGGGGNLGFWSTNNYLILEAKTVRCSKKFGVWLFSVSFLFLLSCVHVVTLSPEF